VKNSAKDGRLLKIGFWKYSGLTPLLLAFPLSLSASDWLLYFLGILFLSGSKKLKKMRSCG